jgi:hypothetical protein
MPKTYSSGLRRRVIETVENGASRPGPVVRAPARSSRMRQLLQACRICFNMSGNRFN